jgi:hypothetical protein
VPGDGRPVPDAGAVCGVLSDAVVAAAKEVDLTPHPLLVAPAGADLDLDRDRGRSPGHAAGGHSRLLDPGQPGGDGLEDRFGALELEPPVGGVGVEDQVGAAQGAERGAPGVLR